LGASGELQTAQHCRAEFYAPGYGWIPVDPSDVRKAIREEQLLNGDPKLTVLKKLLFGFWEMNWVSFNAAQDVNLRGSTGDALPHLLSPVVESGEGRFGKPEDKRYRYTVTANRVFG
jgi:transglutaminase-like putative cysteine protease